MFPYDSCVHVKLERNDIENNVMRVKTDGINNAGLYSSRGKLKDSNE